MGPVLLLAHRDDEGARDPPPLLVHHGPGYPGVREQDEVEPLGLLRPHLELRAEAKPEPVAPRDGLVLPRLDAPHLEPAVRVAPGLVVLPPGPVAVSAGCAHHHPAVPRDRPVRPADGPLPPARRLEAAGPSRRAVRRPRDGPRA